MSFCSELFKRNSYWETYIGKLQKDFEISEEDLRNETWLQSENLAKEQKTMIQDEIVLYEKAATELRELSETELIIRFYLLIGDQEKPEVFEEVSVQW